MCIRDRVNVTGVKYDAKCAYFQTEHNGGATCQFGDNCSYKHDKVADQAEYTAMYKPWENRSPRLSSPRDAKGAKGKKGDFSKGKGGGKDSPRGSPRAFANQADWGHFCAQCMECPGYKANDGSCKKVHCDRVEAERLIKQWREVLKKDKEANKVAKGGRGSPRP